MTKKTPLFLYIYKYKYLCFSIIFTFVSLLAYGTSHTVVLEIENSTISVEVARTKQQHLRGLMHRKTLRPHDGMLFIYSEKQIACMWMKNTLIPLTVLFINDEGYIVDKKEMIPNTETPHCSTTPIKFALELETTWVNSKEIKINTKIVGIKSVKN